MEVAVISEPGQRIGQREPHRAQLAEGRALVERDREEGADERSREDRRALPEHDQDQRSRAHERERQPRDGEARPRDLEHRLPHALADDDADQDDVDRVVDEGADGDLGHDQRRRRAVQGCERGACRGSRDGEHGGVVAHAERRPVLEQLHHGRCEADDHPGLPAVEDDRRDREDERERDAAGVDPVERDRVALRQGGGREQPRDPDQGRQAARRRRERCRSRDGDDDARQVDGDDDRREPRGHGSPRAHRTCPTSPN